MSPPVQDVASEQGPGQDGFYPADSDSEWYDNLEGWGSCKRLLELLREDPTRIHGLGYEDMTVLHKGVQRGCVALVRFVLVDMFDDRGHCKCVRHGAEAPALTREQLLRKTCSFGSTAVNMAVVSGSPKMVELLEWAIKMGAPLNKQSTKKRLSRDFYYNYQYMYRMPKTIRSSYLKKKGREEETYAESITDRDDDFSVPDVTDAALSILLRSSNNELSEVKGKVISVIEGVLEDPGDEHKEWMDMVKKWVAKDVVFEFVPLAHVFLHFLYSVRTNYSSDKDGFNPFRDHVATRIFEGCCADVDNGERGSMLMLTTLFNILDPQGRTFLHVAYMESDMSWGNKSLTYMLDRLGDISPPMKVEFWYARDGAGRSIFHLMGIYNDIPNRALDFMVQFHDGEMAWNDRVRSPQHAKLNVLKKWCFHGNIQNLTPVEFALLLDSQRFLTKIWPSDGSRGPTFGTRGGKKIELEFDNGVRPLQLAAALGRPAIIEDMLKHHTKFGSLEDCGLGFEKRCPPAIHCVAYNGRVEAIQSILKFPTYNPMIQDDVCGSALHLVLDRSKGWNLENFKVYHDDLLCHVLPNSCQYRRAKDALSTLKSEQDGPPRMYSSNEMSCINLLLQAGIDIWTPHDKSKVLPSLGPMANDEARKWWFEKVVGEVVALKTSVSFAANATSVVAALVATTSFIGPFQPPLGYGDIDGFVRIDQILMRMYLVCNSLSFYFSIASILMSVLPAIPMPKESLYDELLRSQRCLKGASLMLLISIVCILISFSSASMAMVSPKWHKSQVVVGCVIFEGAVCVVVLVIYIIRLLRMLFHRNDRFRRMFTRYMYF